MSWRLFYAAVMGVVAYFIGNSIIQSKEKMTIALSDLPTNLQNWRKLGNVVQIHGRGMFYIHKKCSDSSIKSPPTFAIIHGFPSSSFEYHKVLDKLAKYGNVIANDHIGFGFSESPVSDYTYSLGEHADNILALWRKLGIKQAHIISHDMGDSILTEILARRHRKMLPSYFDHFVQSVTFTNGGMNFKMINFRITQSLLMYPKIGKQLEWLGNVLGLSESTFKQQMRSVWSPFADPAERDHDINDIFLLNMHNNGAENNHQTIYYLWDRYHFEFRWFSALKDLDVKSRFIWGDSDSVSPLAIPRFFEDMVPNYELTIVKNKGHFWMMEDPDSWVKEMIKVLGN